MIVDEAALDRDVVIVYTADVPAIALFLLAHGGSPAFTAPHEEDSPA